MKKERRFTSHSPIRIERLNVFKLLVFLVSLFLIINTVCIMESQAQSLILSQIPDKENLDYEILDIVRQLANLEAKLVPVNTELETLKENHERITNEITLLKQELRGPKSLWNRVTDVFSERKLKKLLAESQDISDRITALQKTREPLVRDFITLSDRLIGRSEAKIIILMDIILKNESSSDKASEQVSANLELTRIVKALRDKYTSDFSDQIKPTPLLSLTNDPEKLRLGARFLKKMAIQYRTNAEKKKREIKDLQARQDRNEMILDKWRDIQRSNEEKESSGMESGTANIPSGFNDSEFRRTIEGIKKNIERLTTEVHKLEEEAKNMDNQSKMLEQRASQIESTPKGK